MNSTVISEFSSYWICSMEDSLVSSRTDLWILSVVVTEYTSAVYTGIKKPESFSHSGFSLKVARQLPLDTPKNPNRKTHLRSVIFWNSAEISLFFCQCIIRVFGHVIHDLQRNHPTAARDVMRTALVRSKVERSRACAPLTKTSVWDSGFFAHALFVPKTPNVMVFLAV